MSYTPNRRNHYRVLHVQPEAPPEIIKASYRTLMMRLKLHPDFGGDHAQAAMINEAYAVLSDPERRAEYDRQLRLRSGPQLMRRPLGNSPDPASPCPSSAAQRPPGSASPWGAGAPSPAAGDLYSPLQRGTVATALKVNCAFCQLANPSARIAAAQCSRCGAPLTPVRPAHMPHFGSAGMNRRQSVRQARQSEAVAYWGTPAQRHRVQWRDLSSGGLSVWASQPLAVGQRLMLLDPDIHTVAEVIDCTPGPQGSWLLRGRLLTLRPLKRAGLFCTTQV